MFEEFKLVLKVKLKIEFNFKLNNSTMHCSWAKNTRLRHCSLCFQTKPTKYFHELTVSRTTPNFVPLIWKLKGI